MKCRVEVRCIVCPLIFCCADCRWKHEQRVHDLKYDCYLCRGLGYFCKLEDIKNKSFLEHITKDHLPLYCRKCNQIFNNMEDLLNIDKCVSVSEILDKSGKCLKDPEEIDEKFELIYANVESAETENMETSINSKTAVITPIVRKKHIVDYESSDDSDVGSPKINTTRSPYSKLPPKTPKLGRQRTATPHAKKFLALMRQKAIDDSVRDDNVIDKNQENNKTTPNRQDESGVKEMTTPTSQFNDRCKKLAQIVTTSTPTHPVSGGWSLFPEQGADSPLSEIEGTTGESPAQSIDVEQSKVESSLSAPKLKSIIVTSSRLRLGSQDSSEKQVTFQDSANNTDGSAKLKKVKFADDTVFEQEKKLKRVFRKPKRMLTPGPRKPQKFCVNPRFQALINRFENQGMNFATTPVTSSRERDIVSETTPPVGEHANMPARAINFKEDSPVVNADSEKSNELFKTCVDSPVVNSNVAINTVISALTTNIAGSLQNCLASALKTNEEETEIQFKFVITKRKVTHNKALTADDDLNCAEQIREPNKENIWSHVTKAVKNALWGDDALSFATTPVTRSYSDVSSASSGSKRKCEDMSDSELSPLNHKRHKYSGRIRGRPPLPRRTWGVSSLRTSHSAEQQSLLSEVSTREDLMNSSF